MISSKTHVLKFGGTSLQNEIFIKQAAQIVAERAKEERVVAVVSAVAGVTDTLIELAEQPEQAAELINKLEQQHFNLYCKFAPAINGSLSVLHRLFHELRQAAQDDDSRKTNYEAWKDQVLSFGERASAVIFSAALSAASVSSEPVTANEIIKTNSGFGEARVKQELSRNLIRQKLGNVTGVPVVTGFIASDEAGRITTLGRSGSDYTAGIIADALEAGRLEIWTDVDGVLSADPRWVPTAQNIKALSFDDIEELSAHGASVIHPKTIRPIRERNTAVVVKNSYNPAHPGTAINRDFSSNGSFKTITITGPFVWLAMNDEGAFGLLQQLTGLSQNRRDVFTFKRSSSFEQARFLIDQTFFNQHKSHLQRWGDANNTHINPRHDIYKVKKFSNHFGDGERLMSRVWNVLSAKNLQPLHVEKNIDERFLSFLFSRDEALRAARLFDTYLQIGKKVIDLFIAGNGAIGHTLLRQLRNLKTKDIEFRLLGICNSKLCLWNDSGINYQHKLDWGLAQPTDWETITGRLTNKTQHNLIFVDATGSNKIARLYPGLLQHSVHIVTPSKLANTFEQSYFDKLQTIASNNSASFRYETTVGAGLPVISTLNDLQKSGDDIATVSGVVSGTMTYIFNQIENGLSFSEAVIKARELGYAEPDPRDDLSGEDVARKFLTIARTLGLKIERDELEVESLIPKELVALDRQAFLNRLPAYDQFWKEQFKEAQKSNQTLRYVGELKNGKIHVGVQWVPVQSPIGQLKGTDNLIQVYSRFYNETPLVIQGPGAGKEVTAGGVMSDILKTAARLV